MKRFLFCQKRMKSVTLWRSRGCQKWVKVFALISSYHKWGGYGLLLLQKNTAPMNTDFTFVTTLLTANKSLIYAFTMPTEICFDIYLILCDLIKNCESVVKENAAQWDCFCSFVSDCCKMLVIAGCRNLPQSWGGESTFFGTCIKKNLVNRNLWQEEPCWFWHFMWTPSSAAHYSVMLEISDNEVLNAIKVFDLGGNNSLPFYAEFIY